MCFLVTVSKKRDVTSAGSSVSSSSDEIMRANCNNVLTALTDSGFSVCTPCWHSPWLMIAQHSQSRRPLATNPEGDALNPDGFLITLLGRFSNFFQKKYSKRDQPYSQAANPFGQYIGLSGLSPIPHFYLLFSSILLTTPHLFIINFTNEGRFIIITLIIILISS